MSAIAWMFRTAFKLILLLSLPLLIAGGNLAMRGPRADVRYSTRAVEFDFVGWTAQAVAVKLGQAALDSAAYLEPARQSDHVRAWIASVGEAGRVEAELEQAIGSPALESRDDVIASLEAELRVARQMRSQRQALAETIVQEQVGAVLADLGIQALGAVVPPPAFHMTEVPYALIVSPRQVIQQDANIQLDTDLPLTERIALEAQVEARLDVSALVVPVGGYGTYPTMVQQTGSLDWLFEIVVHEWTHNYLSLRPLGARYDLSPELRTMNETTASLFGRYVGDLALLRFYPELAPPEPAPAPSSNEAEPDGEPAAPPAFDFRGEMRVTRETVDGMLAAGEIEQAEAYMEARRQVFWDHGFQIRRLNQAYFAFHGSYADQPGGAAGDDPVGEAIRKYWSEIDDPVRFLEMMAGMRDPADVFDAINSLESSD